MMNKILKGYLVAVGSFFFLGVLAIMMSAIIASTSSDEWIGFLTGAWMFLIIGVLMIGTLITCAVMYFKNQSQFVLGLLIGVSVILIGIIGFIIFGTLYNMSV